MPPQQFYIIFYKTIKHEHVNEWGSTNIKEWWVKWVHISIYPSVWHTTNQLSAVETRNKITKLWWNMQETLHNNPTKKHFFLSTNLVHKIKLHSHLDTFGQLIVLCFSPFISIRFKFAFFFCFKQKHKWFFFSKWYKQYKLLMRSPDLYKNSLFAFNLKLRVRFEDPLGPFFFSFPSFPDQ